MKEEAFNKLPYISRKELIDVRTFFNNAFEANSQLICQISSVDLYQFTDFTKQYNFTVIEMQFDVQSQKNLYRIHYNPQDLTSLIAVTRKVTFSKLTEYFKIWIDYVTKMHEVTEEYFNPDKKFYDEQFSDFFTNNDKDSSINPFEIDKQEVIYYFLSYAQKVISQSNDIDEEEKTKLCNEVLRLKNDIPKLTKKRFVAALSNFAKKTKTVSNKLFHDIFDVLKKEIIKKLLYEGANHVPDMLNSIKGWLNILS